MVLEELPCKINMKVGLGLAATLCRRRIAARWWVQALLDLRIAFNGADEAPGKVIGPMPVVVRAQLTLREELRELEHSHLPACICISVTVAVGLCGVCMFLFGLVFELVCRHRE